MKIKKQISRSVLILACVLCLQAIFLVYSGSRKAGFHEDEIATYTLSNYADGFISRTEGLFNNWVDGDVLFDTLTVSSEEAFRYDMVYANQERDVHPPLYYYIVHTVSSLFQGQFSKWIGLLPNIIFCLLSSIVLFFLSRHLLKNDFLALVAVTAWAFSIGAVDTATFLRMYAMLTFWTVLFVLLHIKALKSTMTGHKIPVGIAILLFLCTFAGLLTQYYFSVFAFFLCGSFFLYLVFSRNWKEMGKYLLAEFGGIIAAIVYYPAMLYHILGGYRGTEAFRNLKDSGGFAAKFIKVCQLISEDLLNGWGKELIILSVILLVLTVLRKYFQVSVEKKEDFLEIKLIRVQTERTEARYVRISTEALILADIGLVLLCYTIMITKIAPYQTNRYYMCLYPLLVLCVVYVLDAVCRYVFQKETVSKAVITILFLSITFFGLLQQKPDYLYPEEISRAVVLEEYEGKPAIVLNDAYSWFATKRLTEYKNYSEVYLCEYHSELSCLENAVATRELPDGFVLYILRFSESDEEMIQKISEYIPIKECTKLCGGRERVFYCTLEE